LIGILSAIYGKFFYYESYIGLLVKWKRHNGGLTLKYLKYIIWSSFVYILIIWCHRYKFVFNFVLNWF
jgi:phosphate starvation-inducible membrane PsiE